MPRRSSLTAAQWEDQRGVSAQFRAVPRTIRARHLVDIVPFSDQMAWSEPSPFFQFDIGMNVGLRCLNRLMTQPKRDDCPVHAALEKLHRGSVA